MARLELEAVDDNLNKVTGFLEEFLESMDCPMKTVMQTTVALEEMFINICHYAYAPGTGDAVIVLEKETDSSVMITLMDKGVHYDPLEKEDPDVTLSADKRPIGGLGIYMVKKSMDEVSYEYKDNTNIFTMIKRWG
ncbi:MAG: ATP-binding protein [Lachnospiraceae bacterium]|nr:ATP-binding protein [Lachnospiraceae bacterium]